MINQRLYYSSQLILMVLVYMMAVGCQSRAKLTNTIYFNQRKDSLLALEAKVLNPTIQPGDKMAISVNALDPTSVAAFNLNSNSQNLTGSIYLVESDGYINFPQLGKIYVKDYTRSQLVDTLDKRISKYVSDPLVSVQFNNFKVTVLGEVYRPGVISLPDGKGSIIDAIGYSGDLTAYAKKDNILVIREKNEKREFGYVNLLSINVFNSPYFNLQQNDIIYVEPTKAKATSTDQSLVRSLSIITSILSVISSLFFIIINLTK